jgi:hypothetical protein
MKQAQEDQTIPEEVRKEMGAWYASVANGAVFLRDKADCPYTRLAYNLHISKCFRCGKIAVWVEDTVVFPPARQGPEPNEDLPADIITDFEEARSIVNLSPKGSAALLRLCIEKLCKVLGQTGKDLDKDIAALVRQGLDPRVQKALDIVRVIGNEAVHPGVIDLNDNKDTANQLFGLFNAIADQMISHPKHVNDLYGKLPEEKRKHIEERDGKSQP